MGGRYSLLVVGKPAAFRRCAEYYVAALCAYPVNENLQVACVVVPRAAARAFLFFVVVAELTDYVIARLER